MSDQTEPEADPFATDFRDGQAMAREWIEGKSNLGDLLHIVRDMPRGSEMGGLEAGFLSAVDAAVRGARLGVAPAPDLEKAKLLLTPSPGTSVEAAEPPMDLDEMLRRRREHERKARLDELWRANSAIPAIHMPGQMRRDEDWRGW